MTSFNFFLAGAARTALFGFAVGGALGVAWALSSLYLPQAQPVMGHHLSLKK